jgi:hypothetical protein
MSKAWHCCGFVRHTIMITLITTRHLQKKPVTGELMSKLKSQILQGEPFKAGVPTANRACEPNL